MNYSQILLIKYKIQILNQILNLKLKNTKKMSNAYGVDATKGAANTSNPYDFKNVQVS